MILLEPCKLPMPAWRPARREPCATLECHGRKKRGRVGCLDYWTRLGVRLGNQVQNPFPGFHATATAEYL